MLRLCLALVALISTGCAAYGDPNRAYHQSPASNTWIYIGSGPRYMPPPPPPPRHYRQPVPYGYYGHPAPAPMPGYGRPMHKPNQHWPGQMHAPRPKLQGYDFRGPQPGPYGAAPPRPHKR